MAKRPTPLTDREQRAYEDHLRGIRAGTTFNAHLEDALTGCPIPEEVRRRTPRPQPHPDHRGGFFGAAMAHWEFGQRLILAAPDAPAGGMSADMIADMSHTLLDRSLGAIRVDEGTTKEEVIAAFDAIQRLKEARREALGLADPPKNGKKRDVGDWWPGVTPGSIYHRRLTALYLKRRAKVTKVVEVDADDPRFPSKVSQRPPTLREIARVLWPKLEAELAAGLEARDNAEPHRRGEWIDTLKRLRQAVADGDKYADGYLKAAEADLAALDEADDPTPWWTTLPPGCF